MDDFGLLFYNARWFDPTIARFAQADSIVPGGVQGLDRYAYVNNNPTRYSDPTGHMCTPEDECGGRRLTRLTESGLLALKTYLALAKLARENGAEFGMEEFITLIFEREINGFGSIDHIEDLYKEASVRSYWSWASDQFGSHDQHTLLNWLGGHNSVVKSLHNDVFINLPAGKKDFSSIIGDTRDYAGNESKAGEVANALLNPPAEWKAYDPNAPYTFGFCDTQPSGKCSNINPNKFNEFHSTGNTPLPLALGQFNTNPQGMYFKNGISFFLTALQVAYWSSP